MCRNKPGGTYGLSLKISSEAQPVRVCSCTMAAGKAPEFGIFPWFTGDSCRNSRHARCYMMTCGTTVTAYETAAWISVAGSSGWNIKNKHEKNPVSSTISIYKEEKGDNMATSVTDFFPLWNILTTSTQSSYFPGKIYILLLHLPVWEVLQE